MIIPNIWENKKYYKPPTSCNLMRLMSHPVSLHVSDHLWSLWSVSSVASGKSSGKANGLESLRPAIHRDASHELKPSWSPMTFQWHVNDISMTFPAISALPRVFSLWQTLSAPVLQGALYHLSLGQFRFQSQVLRLQLLLPKFSGKLLLLRGFRRRLRGFQLDLPPFRLLLGRLRQVVQLGHQLRQDHPLSHPFGTGSGLGDAENRQVHFRHQIFPGQGVVNASEPHKPWRVKALWESLAKCGFNQNSKVPYMAYHHGIPTSTSLSSSIFLRFQQFLSQVVLHLELFHESLSLPQPFHVRMLRLRQCSVRGIEARWVWGRAVKKLRARPS